MEVDDERLEDPLRRHALVLAEPVGGVVAEMVAGMREVVHGMLDAGRDAGGDGGCGGVAVLLLAHAPMVAPHGRSPPLFRAARAG